MRLLAYVVLGIHGVPYDIWPKKAWNKKLESMKASNDEPTGFCTHSSILFLTWHRPSHRAKVEELPVGHVSFPDPLNVDPEIVKLGVHSTFLPHPTRRLSSLSLFELILNTAHTHSYRR